MLKRKVFITVSSLQGFVDFEIAILECMPLDFEIRSILFSQTVDGNTVRKAFKVQRCL